MRIAIQSQRNDRDFNLPHQGLWFILMFLVMMMLLSKNVAGSSIVDRPTSLVALAAVLPVQLR